MLSGSSDVRKINANGKLYATETPKISFGKQIKSQGGGTLELESTG
jgi:hypothetical protein